MAVLTWARTAFAWSTIAWILSASPSPSRSTPTVTAVALVFSSWTVRPGRRPSMVLELDVTV
ncbi:MAG: hypothetical protein M5U14_15705 [Acidimicrobiia bacterium]|nr:hypothetical protein [Acidimicrobiia bacterium]